MTDKPEALRLADELAAWEFSSTGLCGKSAAELRRLYAERTAADGVINDLVAKVRGLQTQRDALLGALKYHQEQTRPIQRTIDAIKASEENA